MRKIFESTNAHHGLGATCAVLGPRAGGIAATGGRDKEICIWKLMEANPRNSLTGFVSQVESVLFSWNEMQVAGGNTAGAVKIWDVTKCQALCSFTGHRGKVKCLAQNQCEEYFWASGAFDGNVKLWDARSGQLVATYRAHSNKTVTCMEFSPDGRWVVTGGEDCMIKLWDISAGRTVAELSGHSGPLTAVQFHPNEYLLASSSQDKTVRFWDMETFECVSQSAPDSAGSVRSILFDPNGRCLYSASGGGALRVLGWEPARVFDSESCPAQWIHRWQGISALAMATIGDRNQQTLVALCLGEENGAGAVTAFSIDVNLLRPIYASTPATVDCAANNNDLSANNPMRRSFHRPSVDSTNASTKSPATISRDSYEGDENNPAAPITPGIQVDEHSLAFKARPRLSRSPPSTPTVPSDPTISPGLPHHVSSDPAFGTTFTVVAAVPPQKAGVASGRQASLARLPPAAATPKNASTSAIQQLKAKTTATVSPISSTSPNIGAACAGRKVVLEVSPQVRSSEGSSKGGIPVAQRTTKTKGNVRHATYTGTTSATDSENFGHGGDDDDDNDASEEESSSAVAVGDVASDRRPNFGRTFSVSADDFLPKEQSSAALSATFTVFHDSTTLSSSSRPVGGRSVHFANQGMTVVTEEDCLTAVERGSLSVLAVLDHRQRTLTMCRNAWRSRGPHAALELACQMNDSSVVVDLLNILNFRSNIWKLDLCVIVLPQLRQLLDSKYDTYVHTAVNTLRLVLRGFGQIIKSGLQAASHVPSIGVDISQEERVSKCQKCYNELLAIRESVTRKNKTKGDVRSNRNGHAYRELSLMMNSLEL